MPNADPPNAVSVLRELGPWVISLVALIQVWGLAIWKRLRRGQVEIFESGNLQLGYGNLGPSMVLVGTLRAMKSDSFVSRIEAVVKRERDHAQHRLLWWAMRGPASQNIEEPAYGFLLTPAQPFRYRMSFVDAVFESEMRGKLEGLREQWGNFLQQEIANMNLKDRLLPPDILKDARMSEEVFSRFLQTPQCLDLYNDFDRRMYWQAGEYSVELIVSASDGRQFKKRWNFRLSDDDSKRLRGNTAGTLREKCALPFYYASAYPGYERTV